jgi:hypothetical protein
MHVVIVLDRARATPGDVNAGMFSDSNPAAPPELGGDFFEAEGLGVKAHAGLDIGDVQGDMVQGHRHFWCYPMLFGTSGDGRCHHKAKKSQGRDGSKY